MESIGLQTFTAAALSSLLTAAFVRLVPSLAAAR